MRPGAKRGTLRLNNLRRKQLISERLPPHFQSHRFNDLRDRALRGFRNRGKKPYSESGFIRLGASRRQVVVPIMPFTLK